MTHILKIWPGSFQAVAKGIKTHEIRKCDRDFKVGDCVVFREFVPDGTYDVATRKANGHLTNAVIIRRITYVTPGGSWGLPDDLCVFSIPSIT